MDYSDRFESIERKMAEVESLSKDIDKKIADIVERLIEHNCPECYSEKFFVSSNECSLAWVNGDLFIRFEDCSRSSLLRCRYDFKYEAIKNIGLLFDVIEKILDNEIDR